MNKPFPPLPSATFSTVSHSLSPSLQPPNLWPCLTLSLHRSNPLTSGRALLWSHWIFEFHIVLSREVRSSVNNQ